MFKNILFLTLGLLAVINFAACDDDDDQNPISANAEVEISNTLQTAADPSMGGTGGAELPIETILGVPAGTFTLTSNVGSGVEFGDYLDGLYDIDLTESTISYNLVAPADHPIYSNFFRTIEANTFDRYYFRFPNGHNIASAASNNSSVRLNVLSGNEILIEITEGFDFNPGSSFLITLN